MTQKTQQRLNQSHLKISTKIMRRALCDVQDHLWLIMSLLAAAGAFFGCLELVLPRWAKGSCGQILSKINVVSRIGDPPSSATTNRWPPWQCVLHRRCSVVFGLGHFAALPSVATKYSKATKAAIVSTDNYQTVRHV